MNNDYSVILQLPKQDFALASKVYLEELYIQNRDMYEFIKMLHMVMEANGFGNLCQTDPLRLPTDTDSKKYQFHTFSEDDFLTIDEISVLLPNDVDPASISITRDNAVAQQQVLFDAFVDTWVAIKKYHACH